MALRESNSLKMVEAHTSSSTKKPRRVRNREKVSSDASSTDQVVMEPNIWKEFPEELFDSVIARLPIAAIIRFRSVCRKWNSLPASHTFDQHCSEIKQGYPWLYMPPGSMYDPYGKKWYNHPEPSRPNLYFGFPVASAGGLVCLRNTDEIHICNPLTSSSKKLPLPLSIRRNPFGRYIGMPVSRSSTNNAYKILWLERSGDYEVYDSVKNCWTLSGKMPASVALPLNLTKPVAIESTLYFVSKNPDGIVSYDLASGAWEQLLIPLPLLSTDLAFTNCLSLVECRGNIMLVGLLSKNEGFLADNEALRICLWELQRTTLSWEEVAIMPNEVWQEFYERRYVRMTCLGNRGLLLLVLTSKHVHQLVSYDVVSRVWQVCQSIPRCMRQRGRKLAWIGECTMFNPCVTASP